jgi:hypothetical protein
MSAVTLRYPFKILYKITSLSSLWVVDRKLMQAQIIGCLLARWLEPR